MLPDSTRTVLFVWTIVTSSALLGLFVLHHADGETAFTLRHAGRYLDAAAPVITAAATVAIALFTWTLWRTSNKQSELTRNAVRVAESANALNTQNFLVNHRPWMQIDVALSGNWTCDGNTGSIAVIVKMKNVGRSPALVMFPFVVAKHFGENMNAATAVSDFVAGVRGNAISGASFYTLFPDEQRVQESAITVHQEEIAKARAQVGGGPAHLSPFAIVCIDYTSVFGSGHHITASAFLLLRADPLTGAQTSIPLDTRAIARTAISLLPVAYAGHID